MKNRNENRCADCWSGAPVGLTMAIELARYRVAVRLIDNGSQRTDSSRRLFKPRLSSPLRCTHSAVMGAAIIATTLNPAVAIIPTRGAGGPIGPWT